MHAFHNPDAVNDHRDDRGQTGRESHTFREIATILTNRDGRRVSPDQVEQICRMAEAKLAHALLEDRNVSPRRRAESTADRSVRLRNVLHSRDHHRRSGS